MRNYVLFVVRYMTMTVSGNKAQWLAWGKDEDDSAEEKGRMISKLESLGDTVVVNSEVVVNIYLKLDKDTLLLYLRNTYGTPALSRFNVSMDYIFGTNGAEQDDYWTYDSPRATWSHGE
jgi:hypothetical protein